MEYRRLRVNVRSLEGRNVAVAFDALTMILTRRAVFAAAIAYALSGSMVLAGVFLSITFCQAFFRCRIPMHRLAEFEGFGMAAFLLSTLVTIRYLRLEIRWLPASFSSAQLAAICVLISTLVIVVRGGTYIVRGVLRKSDSLPSQQRFRPVRPQLPNSSQQTESDACASVVTIAVSVEPPGESAIDVKEYNRGRLIGNLERIVLTIVVAAGSYAALAFLVAAKGVVRSDEFLIGSLSIVLVALCAGLALPCALIRLWPDLLGLQMR